MAYLGRVNYFFGVRFLSIILLLGLAGSLNAQAADSCSVLACYGNSFVRYLEDPAGQDTKITTLFQHPAGGYVLGGTVGSDIYLCRIGVDGNVLWERRIATGSVPNQLFLVNQVLQDNGGSIVGVGSVFYPPSDQRAVVFSYSPALGVLEYYHELDDRSELSCLIELPGLELLAFGSSLNQPGPVFQRGLNQRIDATNGETIGLTHLLDYGGREQYLNAVRYEDSVFVAGVASLPGGGAGGFRSSLVKYGVDGTYGRGILGPEPVGENSRLLAFDVQIVGQTVYLLHWGSSGVVSGDVGTRVYLSAFDLDLEHQWTRRYDHPEFDGEQAVNLIAHNGGLLFYGLVLTARRDLLLTQVELDGTPRWSKAYELPGNSFLYWHGNRQIYSEVGGLTFASTFVGDGGTNRGVLYRTDPDGNLNNPCLSVRSIDVSVEQPGALWQAMNPEILTGIFPASQPLTGVTATSLVQITPCETPCCDYCPEGNGPTSEVAMLCAGEQRFFYDTILTTSGVYLHENDCGFVDTLTLTVLPPVLPTTESLTLCRGDTLRRNGRALFAAGMYRDTLLTPAGCDSLATYELEITDRPFHYERNELCAGDSIWVFDDWVTTAGRWERRFVDGSDCDSLAIIEVVAVPPPAIALTIEADCVNPLARVSIGVNGAYEPYTLVWADDNSAPPLRELPSGTYELGIFDGLGCRRDTSITLPPRGAFSLLPMRDTLLPLGENWQLNPRIVGTDPARLRYAWTTDGPTLDCDTCRRVNVSVTRGGTLGLTATHPDGCSQSLTLRVIAAANPRVFVPTAFSPNGDGTNDRFRPRFGPEVERVLAFGVYDRWGTRVHARTDLDPTAPELAWDGRAANQALDPAVFVYQLRLQLVDGSERMVVGDVTLLR